MTLTLEAATVIRVAPAGRSSPYALAAVRTDQGLVFGRLVGSVEELPTPGTPVVEVQTADSARAFRIR